MKKRPLCYVCLVFLLIKSVLLLLTGGQSGGLSADSIFQEEKEKEVILQGQVYQKTSTSKMQILYLKNNSINSQNESFYESKIIVYDKTFQNIAIGKTVKLRGKANVFETAHNPGNFDQRQYYAKQNIYGMVWGEQIMEVSGKTNRLMNSLYGLKQAWKEKLTETMGEKNGAVLSAILLSEKKEMDAEIKELYQKNGIGHVLAISGVKTLKLDIPLVPETRINWAFVPLHIAIIYILKLCLDEEIIPRCRFPCSRGYLIKCINWQKKQ